jgi:hypothetical protein
MKDDEYWEEIMRTFCSKTSALRVERIVSNDNKSKRATMSTSENPRLNALGIGLASSDGDPSNPHSAMYSCSWLWQESSKRGTFQIVKFEDPSGTGTPCKISPIDRERRSASCSWSADDEVKAWYMCERKILGNVKYGVREITPTVSGTYTYSSPQSIGTDEEGRRV